MELNEIELSVLKESVTTDSVVQVNENGGEGWIGCLIQVSEVKMWGVQGYVQIPMQGAAYIRLKWNQIEYIGQAVLAHKDDEA